MSPLMLVGWVILISSWVIPYLIEDLRKKRIVGLTLSAIATIIFIVELARHLS